MSESQARVLIVDDEKDICDILFRLLKREGFMPLVAHDGAAALEMIRMGLPDVVLLDVKMPGIDGMEVLKRSKKSQRGFADHYDDRMGRNRRSRSSSKRGSTGLSS